MSQLSFLALTCWYSPPYISVDLGIIKLIINHKIFVILREKSIGLTQHKTIKAQVINLGVDYLRESFEFFVWTDQMAEAAKGIINSIGNQSGHIFHRKMHIFHRKIKWNSKRHLYCNLKKKTKWDEEPYLTLNSLD